MTKEDEQCLKLGREVVRMIRDLGKVPAGDAAFTERILTFPGGSVTLFLINKEELVEVFRAAAAKHYDLRDATPHSQRN